MRADEDLAEFAQGCIDCENGIACDESKGEAYVMGYAYQQDQSKLESQEF